MIWYQNTIEEVSAHLQTSEHGLTNSEATKRIKRYGYNQLATKNQPLWKIIAEPFRSIFVAVLVVAAAFSLLTGHPLDAVIVSSIILINSIIFYTQYYATSKILRSLKNKTLSKVTVVRSGNEQTISSTHLVPGDLIILSEGEKVPADARILHITNLQVNESTLTGESVPVRKEAATLQKTHQIYEQANMLFQGTYVISGVVKAIVVETGERTEFGKIAQLANETQSKSPVQEKIDHLIATLIKVVAVVGVVIFVLSLLRGTPVNEALRFVLALSVSAVPEGLPVALTVIIVLGMRRMAKNKALVRTFKAIEDVGQITTIATDKTGTLTKNHLSVVENWTPKTEKIGLEQIARSTIDHNELIDPLDIAISETKAGKSAIIQKFFPFDLQLRMSGGYSLKDQKIFIKGSPEHIIDKSKLSAKEKHDALSQMHVLASKGYRVIGFASFPVVGTTPPETLAKVSNLHFHGLMAFSDELRREVPEAIRQAHNAGIDVRLITGDHFETAFNIGKQVGLTSHIDYVIQGDALPEDQHKLSQKIKDIKIFARIIPKDKYRILKALKETEITAMTGDGVNDVPALTNAHVGFAMGSGSDIAKDAGDIILLNDNFATIVKAIREGRKIYDNIRKMLLYLLSTNLGQVMTMTGALLFALPLPVTALQILWINLVTDTAMVLPLGLEASEKDIMDKPPRRPNEPLLSRMLIHRMVIVSASMAIVTLLLVWLLGSRGYSDAEIQTIAFVAFVVAQWVNAFNARSETESLFTRIKTKNNSLYVGLFFAIALQLVVMVGPLREAFNIQDVPLITMFYACVAMILSVLVSAEAHKAYVRATR
jgi:Ca2+-transporting ATPase